MPGMKECRNQLSALPSNELRSITTAYQHRKHRGQAEAKHGVFEHNRINVMQCKQYAIVPPWGAPKGCCEILSAIARVASLHVAQSGNGFVCLTPSVICRASAAVEQQCIGRQLKQLQVIRLQTLARYLVSQLRSITGPQLATYSSCTCPLPCAAKGSTCWAAPARPPDAHATTGPPQSGSAP